MSGKLCYKCKKQKRYSNTPYCKPCYSKYNAEYRLVNKDRITKWQKAYNHRYYKENKEALFKKRRGYLREWYRINRKKVLEQHKDYGRSIVGKHAELKKKLREERVSHSDLLWSINFYSALIEARICHYCLGPLDEAGCGLDRVVNELGHLSYNVVPCCGSCNRKKGYDTSYEEMMLLAPTLREIRKRRGIRNGNLGNQC